MAPERTEAVSTGTTSLLSRIRGALAVLGGTPRVLALVWRAHPPTAAAVLLLNAFQGLAPLAGAWLTKLVVDAVAVTTGAATAEDADVRGAIAAAPFVVGLLVARAIYQVVNAASGAPVRYFWQQLSDHVTRDVERRILAKANAFRGLAFFESPRFFDLLHRAQNQSATRPINIVNNATAILRGSLGVGTMAAAFFLFSPWLAVLIVAATIPHLVGQFRSRRETVTINNWSIPEVRKMGYMTRLLTDRAEAKEVRLFGLGDHFLRQFLDAFEAFERRHHPARRRHWRATVGLSALAAAAGAFGLAAVLFAAVEGRITPGDVVLYVAALGQIQAGLQVLVAHTAALFEHNLYVATLFELEAVEDTLLVVPAATARRVPSPLRLGVELRNVSFRYPTRAAPVLEDVSFTIAPGEVVALVGQNGAGKTTLVKLLARLYDPTGGAVLVDGVDLREYDLAGWRRRVGVVLQDFGEYALPVRENIGVGYLPLIDDQEAVRTAAEAAGAAAVVERLPEGYDTVLGRQFRSASGAGVDLSGGEWQRIALARAFMRAGGPADAQLLILDEPTSALDARAEHELYLRFKELTHGRATLLISHRFSTVRMADRIVVLEGGRVVEEGSHDALMARGGEYARLYSMQAERYAKEAEPAGHARDAGDERDGAEVGQ